MISSAVFAWSRIIFILILLDHVESDFEVCNPGVSTEVYKFMETHCPFGVLFNHPITSNCLASTNDPENYIADLCDENGFETNANEKPYKIQLAFGMNDESVDISNSCASDGEPTDKCTGATLVEVTEMLLTEPEIDEDDEEPELTPEEIARQNDPLVKGQTERLFKFMFCLSDDADDDGPNMRLVKILEQSFKIVGKFCDTKYVSLEFGDDILRAFLFLVREADLSRIIDIPVSEYHEIKEVLDMCENMSPTFSFTGNTCTAKSYVQAIEKMGHTMKFQKDEFSFQWGKYDVPVDATWGVLSFVHGLCYGTYKIHVNLHHLFQRAVEKLFTPEIMNRWNRPPKLSQDDIWDHVFSASVKNTMKNLDTCIFAAYHGTPFLHRLERPLRNQTTVTGRKKRSLPAMSLDVAGLEGGGWCFQSKENLIKTTEAYVNYNCPDTTKPLEEVMKMIEALDAPVDVSTTPDPTV